MNIRTIREAAPFEEIRATLREEAIEDPRHREQVASFIRRVVNEGDAALLALTEQFDNFKAPSVEDLRVTADAMAEAAERIDPELLASLSRAADNIRSFHEKQRDPGYLDELPDGSVLGQRVTPLTRVGVYVPGGRAAYPSSVLMNVIPARVAGVESVVMVCPSPKGAMDPAVLAAAHLTGIDEFYRVGGAQAVAALAYGTATIAPVDKIVGPGNRWVAEAKRQVFGRVDIDMVAGPSEILVIADDTANPRHVAADLIGQAEHDPDAMAWLVTDSERVAAAVPAELESLLAANSRREIAIAALERNGLIAIVPDLEAAAAVADLRAPEHLELLVAEPVALSARIRNAGAIFLGAFTPESVGDYFAGPNHVLPTGGTARWASPLGVYDFLKRTSILGYSRERLMAHADDIVRLAESERLPGHAEAVRVRFSS